jgi:hypothetical protein
MLNKTIFSLVFSMACFCFSFSQNKYTLPQITPKAPNQASFAKYGETPVSLSTGMPNVSVSLFNVSIGKFTLPITVSYHNNGLKTDEIPSWIGLGWDLNPAGSINYEQRGNPDFSENGDGLFTSSTYNSRDLLGRYLGNTMTAQQKSDYLQLVINGDVDGQYDLYHYNFLGRSGTFYFDKNQQVVNVPKNNLKIERQTGDFKIADEDGNTYFFNVLESAKMNPSPLTGLETRQSFNSVSSFLLSRIRTAENRDIIFNYARFPNGQLPLTYYKEASLLTRYGLSAYDECPKGSNYQIYHTEVGLENMLISSIAFDEGSIVFDISSVPRQDLKKLSTSQDVPALQTVRFLNSSGNLLKKYTFVTSYFGSNDRLRLDKIVNSTVDGQSETWSFNYFGRNESFPAFFSKSKDHWGFYNGASNGNGIPKAEYAMLVNNWSPELNVYTSADRQSNSSFSVFGMLESITYPTGGKTTFEYEGNRVVYPNAQAINPFLRPPSGQLPMISVAGGITPNPIDSSLEPIFGSFQLSEATTVTIYANRAYDPYSFIYSEVSLKQSGSNFNLLSGLFQCNSTFNYCYIDARTLSLDAGTYTYYLDENLDRESSQNVGNASLSISRPNVSSSPPVPVQFGGLRITKITDNNGAENSNVRRFLYSDNASEVNVLSTPYYLSTTYIRKTLAAGGGAITCLDCSVESKIHDESVVPMVGASVEYLSVTELLGENGENGTVSHRFLATPNLTTSNSTPYVTPFLGSWRGGAETQKLSSKRTAVGQSTVREENQTFISDPEPSGVTLGLKAAYAAYCEGEFAPGSHSFNETLENYQTEKFYRSNAETITHFDNGNLSQYLRTNFTSASHVLPTETIEPNSNSKLREEKIKYSFDFSTQNTLDAASRAIKALNLSHMLKPVEKLKIVQSSGVNIVVGATLYEYDEFSLQVKVVYEADVQTPIPLTNFQECSVDFSGLFKKDPRYKVRASFLSFDNNRNILEEQLNQDVIQSYLWNYRGLYPVVQCKNASVQDIAATSFEGDSKGGFDFNGSIISQSNAPTGANVYDIASGSISRAVSAAKSYFVTYWINNVLNVPLSVAGSQVVEKLSTKGSWVLYRHRVSNSSLVTLSGSGYVDEIRLSPVGSEMTTYTYAPHKGLTSICDLNNRIEYFEYDNQMRLNLVRDMDRNIKKRICYNYQGQQTTCGL